MTVARTGVADTDARVAGAGTVGAPGGFAAGATPDDPTGAAGTSAPEITDPAVAFDDVTPWVGAPATGRADASTPGKIAWEEPVDGTLATADKVTTAAVSLTGVAGCAEGVGCAVTGCGRLHTTGELPPGSDGIGVSGEIGWADPVD